MVEKRKKKYVIGLFNKYGVLNFLNKYESRNQYSITQRYATIFDTPPDLRCFSKIRERHIFSDCDDYLFVKTDNPEYHSLLKAPYFAFIIRLNSKGCPVKIIKEHESIILLETEPRKDFDEILEFINEKHKVLSESSFQLKTLIGRLGYINTDSLSIPPYQKSLTNHNDTLCVRGSIYKTFQDYIVIQYKGLKRNNLGNEIMNIVNIKIPYTQIGKTFIVSHSYVLTKDL